MHGVGGSRFRRFAFLDIFLQTKPSLGGTLEPIPSRFFLIPTQNQA